MNYYNLFKLSKKKKSYNKLEQGRTLENFQKKKCWQSLWDFKTICMKQKYKNVFLNVSTMKAIKNSYHFCLVVKKIGQNFTIFKQWIHDNSYNIS